MIVTRSRKIEKAARKIAESGRWNVIRSLDEVVNLLSVHDDRAIWMLQKRYRDHSLKGHMQGKRELHLSQDDLLIYKIHREENVIELLDIITHEELRKRK